MTATRTIAIGLPDDPNASVYDIVSALVVRSGQLGAGGDFHSAAIISNLIRHIPLPSSPCGPGAFAGLPEHHQGFAGHKPT